MDQSFKCKKLIRHELKLRRDALPSEVRNRWDHMIYKHFADLYQDLRNKYNVYGIYNPIKNEVGTFAIVEHLWSDRKIVSLPAVDKEIEFKVWPQGEELIKGRFASEPRSGNRIVAPEIVITPVLGFAKASSGLGIMRLGYGSGYYDRYFKLHSEVIKLGLAYSCQEYNQIPFEAWDENLDLVITELGVCRYPSIPVPN